MKNIQYEQLKEQIKKEETNKIRNALKDRVREKLETNIKLPKFARITDNKMIECRICKMTFRDNIHFNIHINQPKHQKALDLINQAQISREIEDSKQNILTKRKAEVQLNMGIEEVKITYINEDNEEAVVEEEEEKIDNTLAKANEEISMSYAIIQEAKHDELPSNRLPANFFDDSSKQIEIMNQSHIIDQNQVKIRDDKNDEAEQEIKKLENFIEEFKKDEKSLEKLIINELESKVAPELTKEEQEIFQKVILKSNEEYEEDINYIDNIKKRFLNNKKSKTNINIAPSIEKMSEEEPIKVKNKEIKHKICRRRKDIEDYQCLFN